MAAVIQKAEYQAETSAVVIDQAVRPKLERSDEEIAKDALRALRSNFCIPAERIIVLATNGLVTLEGRVQFSVQRMLAEALMKRLHGITGVRNRLEVKPEDFIQSPKIEIEEEIGD